MRVYIDNEYRCYLENPDNNFEPIETDIFDDIEADAIPYFLFIPEGREYKGFIINGNMRVLYKPQNEYELACEIARLKELNQQYEAALSEIETALGV